MPKIEINQKDDKYIATTSAVKGITGVGNSYQEALLSLRVNLQTIADTAINLGNNIVGNSKGTLEFKEGQGYRYKFSGETKEPNQIWIDRLHNLPSSKDYKKEICTLKTLWKEKFPVGAKSGTAQFEKLEVFLETVLGWAIKIDGKWYPTEKGVPFCCRKVWSDGKTTQDVLYFDKNGFWLEWMKVNGQDFKEALDSAGWSVEEVLLHRLPSEKEYKRPAFSVTELVEAVLDTPPAKKEKDVRKRVKEFLITKLEWMIEKDKVLYPTEKGMPFCCTREAKGKLVLLISKEEFFREWNTQPRE